MKIFAGTMTLGCLLASLLIQQVAWSQQTTDEELRTGNEYQFSTLLGRKINSLSSPPEKLVNNYVAAKQQFQKTPDNVDSIIWYGRRAGYLLRLNEAIQIFSNGIEKNPDDARLYRHRGHRYISMRHFGKAIRDLEHAVELIQDQSNSVEPDGAPNSQGIELTTLHGNIWYHLGLAYYLKNDMPNAERCFLECLSLSSNDDGIVSSSHWLYMILRRQGKDGEAAELVKDINSEMTIIENMTYHQMCLLYAGKVEESELLNPEGENADDELGQSVADVLLYGTGNWYAYHLNDEKKCREQYEKLLANGSPLSFAFIAAESDYARLSNQDGSDD